MKLIVIAMILVSIGGKPPKPEIEIIKEISDVTPISPKEEPIVWSKPCSVSKTKTYMDYNSITARNSAQYKYIRENMTIVDGLLYDKDGYIGVALGSWWGSIGDKWIIKLDTGIELKVVKVEEKADRHVNNGCEHKKDSSVIEFVIDSLTIPSDWWGNNGLVFNGNFNNYEEFKGRLEYVRNVE